MILYANESGASGPAQFFSASFARPQSKSLKAGLIAELDAGILDHFCPLGRFFPDERGKLDRGVADRLEAKFVELPAQLRHRQGPDGFAVQFIQNILRRAVVRPARADRHAEG